MVALVGLQGSSVSLPNLANYKLTSSMFTATKGCLLCRCVLKAKQQNPDDHMNTCYSSKQ